MYIVDVISIIMKLLFFNIFMIKRELNIFQLIYYDGNKRSYFRKIIELSIVCIVGKYLSYWSTSALYVNRYILSLFLVIS